MLKVKIIAGDFNKEIVGEMINLAQSIFEQRGAKVLDVIRVPGCYEVPLVAQSVMNSQVDALLVLGYIEKGETLHGQLMGHIVHEKLVTMQLETRKPIGLGIIGPGATLEQARGRISSTTKSAVESIFRLVEVL